VSFRIEEWAKKVESKEAAACFLLCLLSEPEDGGGTFVRNVSELLPDYTGLHPRRQYSP
jgi:hypothetical protein